MINFLLGSGIHNGKLPSVNQLTQDIIKLPADENEKLFDSEEDQLKKKEIRTQFKKLLEIIHSKIKKYFKNYTITPNYEDIFYILDQIIEVAKGNRYDPIIYNFMTNLFEEDGFEKDILDNDFKFREKIRELILLPGQSLNLLSDMKRILKKSLANENYSKDDINRNLYFIKEIIDNFCCEHGNRINLFSLNHDLILEKFFKINTIEFNDGFSKTSRNLYECDSYLKGFDFDINLLDKSEQINLIKLHGSIDWYYCNEKYPLSDYEGPINDFIYKRNEKSRGFEKSDVIDFGSMVIGTYNKTESYLDYIFIDLFNLFNEELNKSNLLISSGYGFQDSGINKYLIYWMSKNKDSKLLIIHPCMHNLIIDERRNTFFEYSKKLIDEGRIITFEGKFSKARLNSKIKNSDLSIKELIKMS